MIGMAMTDKDLMDLRQTDVGPLQLSQNAVAAAGIDQKIVLALLDRKAGVITPGHRRIAGTQNN